MLVNLVPTHGTVLPDFYAVGQDFATFIGSHGNVHHHRFIKVELVIGVIGGTVDGYGCGDIVNGFALHEFPSERSVEKHLLAVELDGI